MNRTAAIHTAWTLAAAFAIGLGAPTAATAAEIGGTADARVSSGTDGATFVPLGIGKSVVIDLPRDAKDVLVANPAIANAVVRSARRAYLIGVGVGQTNVFFFDTDGRQIAAFDIAVKRDLNGIRAALRKVAPSIQVEGLGPEGVILSGAVASPSESQQAVDLAARLVGGVDKVVNSLTIRERDQVMLKVTVAEVQRDVVKQLGINLGGSIGIGSNVVNFNTDNPFTAYGRPLNSSQWRGGWVNGANSNPITTPFNPSQLGAGAGSNAIMASIQAMEQAGVIRTLAEPNLTAISGESATFLVGGEFPVPGGYTCDSSVPPVCQLQIQWKKFGVGLNFTPIVLAEGRISLKVLTEVSELSPENSIVLQPTNQAAPITIPSIKARRAETTVEIPSGGSLAMAGMIQEQTKQAINGVPGLMQVPILGTLFKSRDYVNRQTELMVLVTPYIVKAVAQKKLSRPDDGFADASDPQSNLMGKLNRIYGGPRKVDQPYHGSYGFILD